ncbi:unnamed protein product [marine sediment metagenome]|uniref:Uncharacterized protein n=1 Tax=marine sediment metagenome TaxID=412755 RepID=X1RQF4_9ZZZZ
MSPRPPFPKFPPVPPSPIKPLREALRQGRQGVEKAGGDIRSIAEDMRGATMTAPQTAIKAPPEQKMTPTTQEPPYIALEKQKMTESGTACLPCSRDHFLTASSSLSEGIRFAREKGIKDHEVMRRIRIALQELDIMERIDLAPEETTKLKGAEKELANWSLQQSRDLRHAITAIKDVETMEQAAAKASQVTEEFMDRLWGIPEEECETCGEIRESIKEFIEKRKREKAGV